MVNMGNRPHRDNGGGEAIGLSPTLFRLLAQGCDVLVATLGSKHKDKQPQRGLCHRPVPIPSRKRRSGDKARSLTALDTTHFGVDTILDTEPRVVP